VQKRKGKWLVHKTTGSVREAQLPEASGVAQSSGP
jgi:hypothetical protein